TTAGLYSFFEGRTTPLGTGLPSWPRSICTSQQKPTTVYAALGKSGVYRSNDSGRTFTFSGYGLSPFVDWTDIACSNTDGKRLYLRANESNIGPFYSNDGGLSWHKAVDPNVGDLAPLEGMYFSSPIAIHPSMANVALLASNGKATILKTEDGGQTWRYSGSGYMGGRVMDIAFTDPNTFYVALTDHGLWQTRDGGQTFDPLPVPNLGGKSVKAAAVSGHNLFIGIGGWALQSLATSSDAGLSWVEHKELTGVFNRIQIHTGRPEVIYAGKYRTLNAGFTWTALQYEIRAIFQGNNDEVFAVDDAGEESHILVSKDMGQTWNSPYPPLPVTAKNVRALAVHPNNDTEMCVGTSVGIFILGGNGWNKRDQQHGLTLDHFGGCYIETISYDNDDPGIIYAGRRSPGRGVSNGIFRSEDGGETWNSWNGNLGNYLNIWSIHCSPFDDTVYIGTSHGTFRTHSGLLASKPLPIKYFVVNPD
ncbi:MAG: WD40/YVTN/BNR-like repeat-containing protein, partial [Thermodesulfobacteriota bacterium]